MRVYGGDSMYSPKGVEHVKDILSRSVFFMVYDDPDIDGVIAGEETRRFLDYFKQPYVYYINENRQHGFKIPKERWEELKGITVLLVDAGMKKEQLVELVNFGINVINIDHHYIEYDELVVYENEQNNCKGVIINNNYSFEPQEYRFLSGAGVVYYTFKAISNIYTDEDKALVGLTLISDIRDLSSDLAKQFLWYTYTVRTPYMQNLIDLTKPTKDWGFGEITLNRNYIDFTFNPKINALFRCNYGDEVIDFFRGNYPYTSERLEAVRDVQNTVVRDVLESTTIEEYSNLYFCTIQDSFRSLTGVDITNVVGLSCSRLVDKGKTTILLVLNDKGQVKRGSLRGKCHDVDYLQLLKSMGVKAEGHAGAFGILEYSMGTVDTAELNKQIALLEQGYEQRKYKGRVFQTNNLSFFVNSAKFHQMAEYNSYVRDNERLYIQYTGDISCVETTTRGKKIEHKVDGITVHCFDEALSVANDLLLPVIERSSYKAIYLRRY